MSSHAPIARRGNPLFILRILWGGLFASTFVYLYISAVVAAGNVEPDPMLLPGLGVAALVVAIASFILPIFLGRQAATRLPVMEMPDPNQGSGSIRAFTNPAQVRARAYGLFFVPFILSLALTEMIAIAGFVARLQGCDLLLSMPFFVVAWLLYAVRFPTSGRAVAFLERAARAKLIDNL